MTSAVSESALLLRQCGDLRDLARGREAHRRLAESGEDRQTYLGNLLVLMYGKCGETEEAIQAFHRIRRANVYSWTILVGALARNGDLARARSALESMPEVEVMAWNTMISAYAQQGHPRRALHLFQTMDLEGIPGDAITFLGAIDACGELRLVARGREIQARVAAIGLLGDLANSLLGMYARCARIEEARRVFEGMPRRDLLSWNTIMAAYSSCGRLDLAEETFHRMEHRDRVSWNTLIVAFAQAGDHRRSLQFLARMDLEGVEPDEITFLGALDACAGLTALAEGELLHSSIRHCNLDSRIHLATSLISMYGRCGDPVAAHAIFDSFDARDVILWNATIAAYAHNGHLDPARGLYRQMDLDGLAKSAVTHTNLLAGFSHGGTLEDGIDAFLALRSDYGLDPGFKHYSCMIDLLARTGKLDEAHDLLATMPFEPDVVSWTSLLAACKLHRDSNLAASVAHRIRDSGDEVVVSTSNFSVQDIS